MSATQNAKATTTSVARDEQTATTTQVAPLSAPELKRSVEKVDMLHFDIAQTFQTVAFNTFILDVAQFTGSTPPTVVLEDLQQEDHEIEVTFGVLPPLEDAVTDASDTPQAQPRN